MESFYFRKEYFLQSSTGSHDETAYHDICHSPLVDCASGIMGEITGEIKEKIKTVESLFAAQEHKNAIYLLLDIIDFFDEIGDFENRDKFLLQINDCYRSLALSLQELQDFFEAAETFCSAAFLQKQHGKNEVTYQLFSEAIKCFIRAGNDALKENSFKEASILYCSAAKYAKNELQDKSQANEYYKKAVVAMKKEINSDSHLKKPIITCRTHLELAEIYKNLEDYQTALEEYKRTVEYSAEHKLFSYTAECYQHMSHCYELLNNVSAKTECLNNAVHYRLLEAEKFSENNLPLKAVQNFIAAANCISRLKGSDELLKNILQDEAKCFMRAAQLNAENGKLLQAAYYERNAAYCYNRLGKPEASIKLLLTAAKKLLAIDEYYGVASSYQDVSLYLEQTGDLLEAASYALEAGIAAKQSGEFEFAIENLKRACKIFQSIGSSAKFKLCNKRIAECFISLAEINFEADKFHFAAFLYYQAAIYYTKAKDQQNVVASLKRALDFYESAFDLALSEDEGILASYSACCATLVCVIMHNLTRAEVLLKNLENSPSNVYYQLSTAILRAFKTNTHLDYGEVEKNFFKIIQNSPEIRTMLEMVRNHF
ncbi:MAG: hypothetical protein ACTSQI_14975 [Candidatus Helarchaeota archaeon]